MRKLIIISIFLLTSIASFSQNYFTSKFWNRLTVDTIKINQWLLYRNDTVFFPTYTNARGFQYKNAADPTDLQDLVTLSYFNDNKAVQPFDSLTLNPNIPDPSVNSALYTIKADSLTKLFAIRFGDPFSGITYINTTINIPFVNTTGDTIVKGTPLSGKSLDFSKGRGLPDVNITNCTDIDLAQTFAGLAKTDVLPGAVGQIVKFNFLVGINTTAWSVGDNLYVDCDSTITNVIPLPPNYKIIVGRVILVGVNGIIEVIAQPFTGSDTDINLQGIINGIITQKQGIRDTVIVGTPDTLWFETYNEENPAVDLPFMASKTSYVLNTTGNTGTNGYARVALVPGTASQSQTNYVYIDNTGIPELAVSTTQFPADGIELAEINVFDIATHQTYGFGSIQRFNNAINGTEADGWVSKSSKRTRENGSKYESGSAGTFELITSGGLDSLKYSVGTGEAWQFNLHTINSTGRLKYLWLNSPTGEQWIDDLHAINVDANGATLRSNNVVYGLNLFYFINSGDFDGFIAVNAPNGSYNNDDAAAIQDDNSFAITTVQTKYDKIAFRHARAVIRYTTTGGGTFINPIGAGEFQNERGQLLGSGGVGGGIGDPITSFPDVDFSVFNNADATKIIQLDASLITTGNTRTLTVQDASGTIALLSDLNHSELTELDYASSGHTGFVQAISSTDHAIARYNGTGGAIQNSNVIIYDSGNLSSVNTTIFDAITAPAHAAGTLFYDLDDDELSFYDSQTDSKLNIGSEIRIKVRNVSGTPIPDFTPVYQTGAVGNRATIDLAKADSESTSRVIAITTNLIGNNTNAAATTGGTINGVDTDGSPYGESWGAKDEIYLSATTAGWLTNVAPTGNNIVTSIGYVLTASNTGSIEVHIAGANVRGAASSIDNNLVRWDGNTGKRIQEGNASLDDSGILTAVSFISNVAIGTQPYAATSTTLNNNLNADLLDGLEASEFDLDQVLTNGNTSSLGATFGNDVDITGSGSGPLFALDITNTGSGDGLSITTADVTANNAIIWDQGAIRLFNLFSTAGNVAVMDLTGTLDVSGNATAAASTLSTHLITQGQIEDGSIDADFNTISAQNLTSGFVPRFTTTLVDSPIQTDGTNVGIGVSPDTKLHVENGSLKIVNNGDIFEFYESDVPETDAFFTFKNGTGTSNVFVPRMHLKGNRDDANSVNDILFDTFTDSAGKGAVANFSARLNNAGPISSRNAFEFSNWTTKLMIIDASGNINVTGNLTIGTQAVLGDEVPDLDQVNALIADVWTDAGTELYPTNDENIIIGNGTTTTEKSLILQRGTIGDGSYDIKIANNSTGEFKIQRKSTGGYVSLLEANVSLNPNVILFYNGNAKLTTANTGITLAAGATVGEFSIDGTLAGNSDNAVPTEKAVKTYVDAQLGGDVSSFGTPTDGQIALWTDATTIEGVDNLIFLNDDTNAPTSISGTVATSMNLNGSQQVKTLTGNVDHSLWYIADGQDGVILYRQDGTGSRNLTLDTFSDGGSTGLTELVTGSLNLTLDSYTSMRYKRLGSFVLIHYTQY